jgi:hypothetical protein
MAEHTIPFSCNRVLLSQKMSEILTHGTAWKLLKTLSEVRHKRPLAMMPFTGYFQNKYFDVTESRLVAARTLREGLLMGI